MNVQHIKLNIIPGGVLPVVHVSQYDHNAGGLVFDIYNGGELYELPEGTTASIEGTKPDEYGFLYPAADVSSHSVTIDIVEQMTVVPGKVICELRLAHQQDNIGTINFILAVEPAGLSDDTEVSETDIPLLREAIEAGQQALQSAEQAGLSADRAEAEADRAEEAADSLTAIRTTVPGETVEVDDAKEGPLQQFRADFEPRQDLHGYERPWPAGANKNLLPVEGASSSASGLTFTYNDDGTVKVTGESLSGTQVSNYGHVVLPAGSYIINGCPDGGSTSTYRIRLGAGSYSGTVIAQNYGPDAAFTLEEETDVYARLYVSAAAGEVDLTFAPMIRKATEADDTYEPYANICPIEGTTGPITVTRTGKNITEPIATTATLAGVSWEVTASGKVTASGAATGNTQVNYNYASGVLMLPKGIPLTVNGSTTQLAVRICYRTADAPTTTKTLVSSYDGNDATGTLPDNTQDSWVRILDVAGIGTTISAECYPMVRLASETDDTYEPFVARDEYAITIPSEAGTVYGGTLTVNSDGSGQLVVDRALVTYDGTENWTAVAGAHPSYRVPRGTIPANATGVVSNMLIMNDTQTAVNGHGYVGTTNLVCYLDSASADNLATWKSYLAAHPMQIVYYLATPIAYPLTGAQVVQMLQGSNVLWMDVEGQLRITYVTTSQLSGIVEELDELQANVAEIQPVVEDLQTNAVKKSEITQTGTVTTAGQYVVDARQLNPDLTGTIAKRITDLETDAATDVKTADITRATNITATGTKVVDAYELNASKNGTLAKKISDAATAASAAQTTANTANTAAGNANTALGGFSFGFTADNKPGYKQPGADTVVPFSDGSLEDLTTTDFPITFNGAGTFTRTVPGTIIAAGTVGFTANVDYITAETRSGWPSVSFSDDTLTVVVLHPFGVTVTAMVRVWYIPA